MAMKFEKKGDNAYMLDVCGYVCPHPQIYCKKSLEKMAEGDTLEMIFDNPSSAETIVQMCDQAGHEIVQRRNDGSKIIFMIQKG